VLNYIRGIYFQWVCIILLRYINFPRMRRRFNNIFSYALILCFGFALLLGQASKLHMHVQHESKVSFTHSGHSIALHPAFSQQDAIYDDHYHNDSDRPAEIEVSSSSLVKKAKSFSTFILLFTFIALSLCVIPLYRFRHKWVARIERPPLHYLFHPPLRAPPLAASV